MDNATLVHSSSFVSILMDEEEDCSFKQYRKKEIRMSVSKSFGRSRRLLSKGARRRQTPRQKTSVHRIERRAVRQIVRIGEDIQQKKNWTLTDWDAT